MVDSILGHQVAPQNYAGSIIALDHVLGGQYLYYHIQGYRKGGGIVSLGLGSGASQV